MPVYKNASRRIGFQSLTTSGAANLTVTPVTQVSQDGSPFANTLNTPTHIGNGCWQFVLTATEMNGDLVALTATGAGLLTAEREFYPESDYTQARALKLDNADAAVSSRLAGASYAAAPSVSAIAAVILASPLNLIATDATGRVTAGNLPSTMTVAGYATGQDPGAYLTSQGYTPTRALKLDNADAAVSSRLAGSAYSPAPPTSAIAAAILASPSNLIATDATGAVSVSMTQPIPLSNTAQTIGDALNAARAQGFGQWLLDPNAKTLKLFGPDGVTIVRTFTLDSVTIPTART